MQVTMLSKIAPWRITQPPFAQRLRARYPRLPVGTLSNTERSQLAWPAWRALLLALAFCVYFCFKSANDP